MNLAKYLDIAPEVKSALEKGKPVVALESTIISHGMPYPQNVNTARNVEKFIRAEGAVPATIAIIGGKFKVGLSDQEIEYFGKKGTKITKASRRDLPILAACGMDGATTVASTMIIAAMAGIKIFATGGIGGVHRGAETTMDISADLEELGRTDVMVVCAGAKSILDIGLTLEYLETKGVPVIGYGTDELPAFYCRESGFGVDYRINTPNELAAAFKAKLDLGIHGGMLVGNPIPKEYAMSKGMADRAIEIAVKKAEENNIKGKELTPFLLTLVKEMTGGMSLDSNIELVYNNAKLAAKTAVQLAALSEGEEGEESLDELRAEIADDTAESIKAELNAFRGEMETLIAQRVAAVQQQMAPNPYMNP
ncbi:MAG: pseudouridine-5'-phosphate glycosidase, partial [Oscillospiraceae bacterium]|nr:pseudouridine-5'-phosphate glycosidase [Oscillospiraceae bacterium]